jgi:DNA (cytosine-5)-methyltransferase 1
MKAIDLFSGGGLGSAGVRQAGFTMVGAVDSWDVATRTYADNFPSSKVVNRRLNNSTGSELFGRIPKIDLVIASPECTHHSIARGNRPRSEESRRSGWYIMKFVRELDPRWIVLENVTPMRYWKGFEGLLSALRKSYNIRVEAFDAADFGVPQNRRRLFIVGDKYAIPMIAKPKLRCVRTAAGILAPSGTFPAEPVYNGKRAKKTIERIERGIEELGKGRDFLTVYYGSDRAGGWQPLDRPLRTLTTLDRFGLVQWIGKEPTLRMLQVPELKRAMGLRHLSDERGRRVDFALNHGSRRDKIRILGNGVCAPVMKAIAASLLGGGSHDALPATGKS